MSSIDREVLMAQKDGEIRERLLSEYSPFILRTAGKVSGQYVTKQDDRWSAALFAFNEAIDHYSPEKGGFLSFAELVIKRRLFDQYRKQMRRAPELPVDPASFQNEPDDSEEDVGLKRQIVEKTLAGSENPAKLEIEEVSEILAKYGFSFGDLILVSPKAEKTRRACALAVACLCTDRELLQQMKKQKTLPAAGINKKSGVPPKIMERHRKYIIAAAEILTGDYPILGGYLEYVKEVL